MRPTQIEGKSFTYGTRPTAPTGVGIHAFEWDRNGNMLTREFFDVNGVERSQTLTWDQENRLSSVVGTGNNGSALTETYLYDVNGRRLRQVVNGYPIYYPSQYAFILNNITYYLHYFFGGMRIGERATNAAQPMVYRHGDQVDSAVFTNKNGVNKSRRYTAFGKARGGSVDSNYTYTGQMQDASGLIYMNARYYDSSIGIFISPDTIIPNPADLMDYNRYTYGRGNPVSYSDPSGHFVESDIPYLCEGCKTWDDVSNVYGADNKSFFAHPDVKFGSLVYTDDGSEYTLILKGLVTHSGPQFSAAEIKYTLAAWDNLNQTFGNVKDILSASSIAVWSTNSTNVLSGYTVGWTRNMDTAQAENWKSPWQQGFDDLRQTISPSGDWEYGVHRDINEWALFSAIVNAPGYLASRVSFVADMMNYRMAPGNPLIDKRYPMVTPTGYGWPYTRDTFFGPTAYGGSY